METESQEQPNINQHDLEISQLSFSEEVQMVKETQRIPQRVVGESQNQCFFASQYVSECGVCGEKDLGYNSSGQSSMSSCRCENTQNSQQESNVATNNLEWDGIGGNSYPENTEIDDLIYHFGQFFGERIEKKIQDLSSFMGSMMNEQQIHVQQIVNAAVKSGQSPDQNQNEEDIFVPSSPVRKMSKWSSEALSPCLHEETDSETKRSVNMHKTPELKLSKLTYSPNFRSPSSMLSGFSHFTTGKRDSSGLQKNKNTDELINLQNKNNLVLELLKSTCALSTLLNKREFRV